LPLFGWQGFLAGSFNFLICQKGTGS